MRNLESSYIFLVSLTAVASQDLSWCTDDKCENCPSAITGEATGYPTCAVYDTETVFGGQGFQPGTNKILYNVYANFGDPCNGLPGNIAVRSPASINAIGCGDLIVDTTSAECSGKVELQDTFMVQFCCGSGDCTAEDVPYGRRSPLIGGHTDRRASAGASGVLLSFSNGTAIPPKEVGTPPSADGNDHPPPSGKIDVSPDASSGTSRVLERRKCTDYKKGSFAQSGEPYIVTKNTVAVTASVGPLEESQVLTNSWTNTEEASTSFSASVTALEIISVSTTFEFSISHAETVTYAVTVPAGESGRIGFTPYFQCVKGTLTECDGTISDESESCAPYLINGVAQGDYTFIQE